MKIAVLSDIHDNIWNLDKALTITKERGCEHILALGDYCAPFSVAKIAENGLPTDAVFGNNDGDQGGIVLVSENKVNFSPVFDEFKEVEINGKKIAITHYPTIAKGLLAENKYDAIFFGHTHQQSVENHDNTLLCNPGAVCGIGRGRPISPTFAIYDTETNAAEIVEIT